MSWKSINEEDKSWWAPCVTCSGFIWGFLWHLTLMIYSSHRFHWNVIMVTCSHCIESISAGSQSHFCFCVGCCCRGQLILWDLDSGSIKHEIKPSQRESSVCISSTVQDLQADVTAHRETIGELPHHLLHDDGSSDSLATFTFYLIHWILQ